VTAWHLVEMLRLTPGRALVDTLASVPGRGAALSVGGLLCLSELVV